MAQMMPFATCWLLNHHQWVLGMWAKRTGTGKGGSGLVMDCEKGMVRGEAPGGLSGLLIRLRDTYGTAMTVLVGQRDSLVEKGMVL